MSIEGLVTFAPNGLDPDTDLEACQENSFVFLYRLLFILYAEDRGFLPYRKNDTYTKNRSLARFRRDVAAKLDLVRQGLDKTGYSRTATTLWTELRALCDLVDSRNRRYEVPPYNGSLFSSDEHPFLDAKQIPNNYVALVLDQLSRAPVPGRPSLGLSRVDYRDLAIQQLGSVYEGLLELRPRFAREDMIVVRSRGTGGRSEKVVPARDPMPQGCERTAMSYQSGSVYLETDKGERRAFGSYYTPDHIVNHIIDATLGQACRDIEAAIRADLAAIDARLATAAPKERKRVEAERDAAAGSFADRVLGLRILDPAMSSGHFLIRACQYLAEEIATNPHTRDLDESGGEAAQDAIAYWKRRVAETCLFGVDVNGLAVGLAKLALWLETVAIDAPLAFLDHHFQSGDSLIGARIAWLESLPGKALVTGVFKGELDAALPSLLDPLNEIRALPSKTLEAVKKKEQLFKRRFRDVQKRFTNVANFWCATAAGALSNPARPTDYAGVLKALSKSPKGNGQDGTVLIETADAALDRDRIHCFHWELAFPEVFLPAAGIPGFDVVIGNPPYDVLAEKEAGPHVRLLKSFASHDPTLSPSVVGKNNLYKLFICRAVELTREGGYVRLIVPMPLLGDEQARGVRRLLLQEGTFLQAHGFPQKDNVARRVFKDAKLSTCVFVFRKGPAPADDPAPFPSFRHTANTIDRASPSLKVWTVEIPLYDSTNLAILSCAQSDWDLAVRVARMPGIRRLGTLCKSYQGEVNEKTDSRFLSDRRSTGRQLVLRGSNVCMYVLRGASQGEALYLDSAAYQAAKKGSEKAFHTRLDRVGFQRSAPQNNYRRVIAAFVPAGEFCFDTVSYVPRSSTNPDESRSASGSSEFEAHRLVFHDRQHELQGERIPVQ